MRDRKDWLLAALVIAVPICSLILYFVGLNIFHPAPFFGDSMMSEELILFKILAIILGAAISFSLPLQGVAAFGKWYLKRRNLANR